MNIININNVRCVLNKNIFKSYAQLIADFYDKRGNMVRLISNKMEGAGEKFSNIMMKLSIIKLALALVTLIVMTVLFVTHLHVFDPITLHFSRWTTSPLICFIMLVVSVKFVGLSTGLALTLMSTRKLTFESLRLRFTGYFRSGLCFVLRRKVQHQSV